jgi:hypothetical protein
MSRWRPKHCVRCQSNLLCDKHNRENGEHTRWMRYKNGDYGDGNPTRKRARWETQAGEVLDRLSPSEWGEDFAIAWAIATEIGRVRGLEPVVMRLNEREWQQLQRTSPAFCAAPARLSEEDDSPRVKKLFQQDYLGYHLLICLLKSNKA